MKNTMIAVLLATTLIFGAMALKQNQRKNEAQTALATASENTAELQSRLVQQEKRSASLQNRLQETRTEAEVKADQVNHLAQVITNQAQTASNSSNPMAEMFKNKDMRELIKTQQKAVLGPMIEKTYGGFFTALGLTPDQTTNLRDLIVKKSLVDAQAGVSMMAGEVDAEKRKELVQQTKAEKDAINEQIKAMLGDDNYGEFQAYEKTVPERMSITMFKDQQGTGTGALNPDQENRLVQAMSEERGKFKFTTDFYDQSKLGDDLGSIFTDENVEKFQQEKSQLDQQFLERARAILSTEQIGPFEKFLTAQSDMQRAGMKMAIQMFGHKTAAK